MHSARVLGSGAAAAAAAAVHGAAPWDVVIVGAGMAGSALAAALSSNPLTSKLRVAVLDSRPPAELPKRDLPDATDCRVSALSPASISLLRAVGAWRSLAPAAAPFCDMQVWGSGAAPASVHCSAASVGSPALAYVAEEQLVVAALHRRLRAAALAGGGVHLLMPARMEGVALPPYSPVPQLEGGPLVRLTLEGGSVLSTRLLVGADGRDSLVRRCSQIRSTGDGANKPHPYPYHQQHHHHQQQQASPGGQAELLASVTTMHPHNAAFLRFLPTGPLALLPARHGSVVAWTCPAEMAAQLQALPRHELAAAISDALTSTRRYEQQEEEGEGEQRQGQQQQAPSSQLPLAGLLGNLFGPARGSRWMEPPGVTGVVGEGPIVLPVALQHAGQYTRPRLALIGEAAHAVHPLARQGANLGLADAKALSKVIASAVETGQDIGSPALLDRQYAQPMRRANAAATAAMGTLLTLFKPQVGPMAAVRSLGLGLVDAAPALKQTIMRLAMHGLD